MATPPVDNAFKSPIRRSVQFDVVFLNAETTKTITHGQIWTPEDISILPFSIAGDAAGLTAAGAVWASDLIVVSMSSTEIVLSKTAGADLHFRLTASTL